MRKDESWKDDDIIEEMTPKKRKHEVRTQHNYKTIFYPIKT